MVEIIAFALQILLVIISIAIVLHKNNSTLVILIASFGFVAATLYTLNQAPDVAIAEVAISSAIIPLIYVLSISRQREFIVIDNVDHTLFDVKDEKYLVVKLLEDFVRENKLKLNISSDLEGICEEHVAVANVDLMIFYNSRLKKFELVGKSSSILINKLRDSTKKYQFISIYTTDEGESHD